MADTKLADMTAATVLADANLMYVEQAGVPKKMAASLIPTYVAAQASAISALSAASALGGTEAIPGVQGGSSVKLTPAQMATYVTSTYSANAQTLLGHTFAQMRTDLALVIGTNTQAWDADLDSWAAITRASGFDTFAATPSSANLASLVTDETGTGALVFGTSPTISTKLTLTGATETTSNPALDGTQTWNAGAVTFTGWKLNVTDTASAAASKLLDIQVGGTSVFHVRKSGRVFSDFFGDPDGALIGIYAASGATNVTLYSQGGIALNANGSTGAIVVGPSVTIPAGGTAGTGVMVSSTTNFGVFYGSGAPSLSAAKGSLYLRSDGSGVADRIYVNTNGSTTWTNLASGA